MSESLSVNSWLVWKRVALRLGLMASLWWGLTGVDWHSWLVGLPVVAVSTALSLKLGSTSDWRWSFGSLLPFAWYFTRQSILSGWDVARRALHPNCRLNPGLISYNLDLPSGSSRLFFCGIVSLLPGTLVVSIDESKAWIHVLDTSIEQDPTLEELETRIARLFGLSPYRMSEKPR